LIEELKIVRKTAPFIYPVSNETSSVKRKIKLHIDTENDDIIDSITASPVV
jgi:hypothetical protein